MKRLFSINAEGGPLLLMDAATAGKWRGVEAGSSDYQELCAILDDSPSAPGLFFNVGGSLCLAWEMSGAGTADVFRKENGVVRLVRAWLAKDTPEELQRLADAEDKDGTLVGELPITSGYLAVLWAPESGETIFASGEGEVQEVKGTSIDESAFLVNMPIKKYACVHDEVAVGDSQARRLSLIPL